ncbi:MAG: hypothetical protein ACREBC_32310, partial [Pyrinomonadaceae bacterium]
MKQKLLLAEIDRKVACQARTTRMAAMRVWEILGWTSGGAVLLVLIPVLAFSVVAQTSEHPSMDTGKKVQSSIQDQQSSLAKYFDPSNGLTVDDVVAYALAHNGELLAARKEIEAARALVKQAGLR